MKSSELLKPDFGTSELLRVGTCGEGKVDNLS